MHQCNRRIRIHSKFSASPKRQGLCNGCNMDMRDLADMYARGPRATGPRVEGMHIRQITNGHVTTIMYHFVPIVTTPVV